MDILEGFKRSRAWRSLFVLGLILALEVWCRPVRANPFPPLIPSLKVADEITFCGERVPLEIQDVRERFEKEMLLSLWDRPQVILWLKRSRRYLPIIEDILRRGGVPHDLKYIPVAESALRPHAGSRKGAIGFWQFREDPGRRYGLTINGRIDQRRNIFSSTRAAVRCLKDLHEIFRSWALAAAAYNMGKDGLLSEIMEQGTRNYYRLYLPLETQRYLFRIISVKLILENPESYGFQLTHKDYYPPLSFDRVEFECFEETPIALVANAAKTHFKMIKDLNPEIRGYYLAPGKHVILVPRGGSKGFQPRYKKRLREFLEAGRDKIYIVREGDNLSAIAEQFDIPITSLILWNKLDPRKPIHPGDKLVIYPSGASGGESR
ncbi:MAG: transglycosylase SLT domain-containing protein [Deltaproteobacteria bacterium]|nr:transglycosylase SLT domain-containing protein [Deltaproteobacteria bacterium]MBW2136081.1 transglycosylase SLT domain-containing protein [Deltaproteobacteria bacterium]